MKRIIKKFAGLAMSGGPLFDMVRSVNRRKLLILYYHRVVSRCNISKVCEKDMCVDTGRFDAQMKFLSEHYNVLDEDAVIASIEGRSTLPDNAVWVTFDDGFKDNYVNAYPILCRHGIPATFFVTTGFINRITMYVEDYITYAVENHPEGVLEFELGGAMYRFPLTDEASRGRAVSSMWGMVNDGRHTKRRYLDMLMDVFGFGMDDACNTYMDWAELKDMLGGGQFMGGHTVNHRTLSTMTGEDILDELTASKLEIRERLGVSVKTFAYPKGKKSDFDIDMCAPILRACGFKLGVTTMGGHNDLSRADSAYNLRRLGVSYDDSLDVYKLKLSSGGFWQS